MFLIETVGYFAAVEAARNYRFLRAKGITVRKTIDTLIATRCILDGHELLHSDRDFDPFVEHLELRVIGA
jgi:predicted nucleic acid-binding protein